MSTSTRLPGVLLLLKLLIFLSSAQDDVIDDCAEGIRLELKFLSSELHPDSVCADGTQAGYYISQFEEDEEDEDPPARSFVIWLGDSSICAGQACIDLCEGSEREALGIGVCEGFGEEVGLDGEINEQVARCLASRATCTSAWWDTFSEIDASTILCSLDEFFGDFERVFVPICSLDYWLGNETPETLPEGSFSEFLFRGNQIFDSVIDELINVENLTIAPQIVLGGTRGGGIGAINQVNHLRQKLTDAIDPQGVGIPIPEIKLLIDSSWIVSVEKFAASDEERINLDELFSLDNAYRVNSSEWIQRAQLFDSCKAKFDDDQLHKCLYPSEIVKFHLNNPNNGQNDENRALFVQSQYDLFQLADLGLIDFEAVNRFEDEASFGQAAFNFIENYGQQIRNSINEAARSVAGNTVGFFSPACGQHGYIVPTVVHTIETTEQEVGEIGSIRFQRDESAWLTIKLGNQKTAREAIVDFVQNGRLEETIVDSCGEFLCNDQCLTQISPFTVTPLVGLCFQQLILVYATFVALTLVLAFLLSTLQICRWRHVCKSFWIMTGNLDAENGEKTIVNQKFGVVDKKNGDEEVEFLKMLAVQRNQTADEVQEQLIIETNADSQYRRVHLMVEDLCYWAPPRAKSLKSRIFSCGKGKIGRGKQIIRNLTAAFEPGKVHALMGPSGSGKTTLLDLISLSKTTGKMSGTRYINGVSANAKVGEFMKTWLKHNQSYVSQQDTFFPNLTVREHLEHSAWLILPEYMPDETKLNRVWQLIRLLDLSACADTICGDGGVNYEGGISGGQRRRLSVATQLLLNPCVLFLDEPTSGLDSVSALNLVRRMQVFARKAGTNVIMTIHQPRREIYQELDKLYILVKGRLIFTGSVEATADFFSLDLSNERINVGNELLDLLKDMNAHDDPRILAFEEKFRESEVFAELLEEIENEKTFLTPELAKEIRETLVFNSLAEGRHSWRSPSSVFWLQWVLLSRTLKRGAFNLFTTTFLSIIAGLVLGGLFYQADSYASKTGLAYLMVSTLTFLQGVFLARRYFDEKDMFDFEKKSGTMRSWQAFLLAQFSRDAVTAVFESLAFAIPAYLLGGFSIEIDRFLYFLVLAGLIGYATTSQNVLVQIDRNTVREAATIQIGLLALGALFNGFIVPLEDLPPYYSWIPYVMLNFYGFVGILTNEFADFTLPCDLSDLECGARTGDVVLQTLGYDDLDLFLCALALILLILFTRSLGAFLFYFKYARSGNLKRVSSDGASKRVKKVLDLKAPGQTITKVLAAQKSSRMVQASMHREPETNNLGRRPDSEVGEEQSARERGGMSKRFEKRREYVDSYDEAYDSYEDEDFDPNEIEEEQSELEHTGWVGILLSRQLLVGVFAVDLASAGYICGLREDTRTFLIGVAGFLLVLYAFQFFFQLGYLIPYTLEKSHREFAWAAFVDGPSFLLLIFDTILVFLQFAEDEDLLITQALTLSIRLIRVMRIQLYFYKGSKAHRIRAESFLNAKNKIVMEYIAKLNAENPMERPVAPTLPPRRANWLKSLKLTDAQHQQMEKQRKDYLRQSSEGTPSRPQRPARPARPPRPRTRAGSATKSNTSNGNSKNSMLGRQMQRYQRATSATGSGSGLKRQISGGRRSGSPNRNSGAPTGNVYTKANGWVKYRNDKTGQMIYYNKYTGKWVDVKDVENGKLL